MSKFNEIVYNIKNLAEGGISNRSSNFSNRQIGFWVQYYRARFISEYTRKIGYVHQQLIQDMGIVTLTEVDKAQGAVKEGCIIKMATIPKLVDLPGNKALTYVGKLSKQDPFILAYNNTIGYAKHKKFTSQENRAYIIGQDLYVETPKQSNLTYINIQGVFEDPFAVPTHDVSGNSTALDPETDEYPMPARLTAMVTEAILKVEMGIHLQTDASNDKTNNAQDDPAIAQKR